MRIYQLAALSLISFCFCIQGTLSAHSHADTMHSSFVYPYKTLLWGTIQFPKEIINVPDIRIYYCGQRIKCEADNDLKRINFAIPDDSQTTSYTLVITDNLEFVASHNVIKYWKVRKNMPYKCFCLETTSKEKLCSLEDGCEQGQSEADWKIVPMDNSLKNGHIPDDAIIICVNSAYVDCLQAGSATTLPLLKMRSDLLTIAGSESKLHEFTDKLLLELINYDTFHEAMRSQELRPACNPKTVLTMTT